MKPTCFLALLMALPWAVPLSAQYFERTFDLAFYNEVIDLLPDPNGDLLLITQGGESYGLETVFASRLDSVGNTQAFPISSPGTILDVKLLPVPGGYVVSVLVVECDIIVPPLIRFLDLNGQEVWSRSLEEFEIGWGEEYRFLPGQDSTFWIFRQQAPPLRVDLNGVVVDNGASLPMLPLFDFFFETPGQQYIVYGNGDFARYNATLTSILYETVDLPYLKDIAQLDNGDLVGVDEIYLYRLDTNLNLIKTEPHLLTPFAIHAVAAGDSAVWVLHPGHQLRRYDLDLMQQQVLDVPPFEPFGPKDLAISPGRLVLAGEEIEWGSGSNTGVAAVRSFPPDAPYFSATPDAGVSGITADSVIGYSLPLTADFSLVFQEVHVTVTNYSNAPLQEITVKGVLGSLVSICPFQFLVWEKFEGLHVAPGESVELDLDTLYTFFHLGGLPSSYELCLRTVLPNDSLDRDHDNNGTCTSLVVTVPTQEPTLAGPLKITPNPAATGCRVSWEQTSASMAIARLFDATGRLVREERLPGNEWEMERRELPAGLYRAVVWLEDGRVLAGSLVFN